MESAGLGLWRKAWVVSGIFFIPALYVVVLLAYPPSETLLAPDSYSYVNFGATRTSGYPFFLQLLKPIVGDLSDVTKVQLTIYGAAAAWLGWQLIGTSKSVLVAMAAEALLFCNSSVNSQHFTILTESIFLSVSIIFVGATVAYLKKPSAAALGVVAVAVGLAATIRPTGLAFVPVVFLLILLRSGEWKRAVVHSAVAIGLLALLFVLDTAYFRATHDGPRQSLVPMLAFAKGALVDVPDAAGLVDKALPESRALHRSVETEIAGVRELIAGAPSATGRCRLTANYETFIQYQFQLPLRAALVTSEGEKSLTAFGLTRITQAPTAYIGLVARNLYCLWTVWSATNSEKGELATYLAARRPIPFDAQIFGSLATSPSSRFIYLVRLAMEAIAVSLAFAAAAVVWSIARRQPLNIWLSLAGICGLAAHGGLLLTALSGVAIPRYTLALWVPMSIAVLAGLLWVFDCIRSGNLLRWPLR